MRLLRRENMCKRAPALVHWPMAREIGKRINDFHAQNHNVASRRRGHDEVGKVCFIAGEQSCPHSVLASAINNSKRTSADMGRWRRRLSRSSACQSCHDVICLSASDLLKCFLGYSLRVDVSLIPESPFKSTAIGNDAWWFDLMQQLLFYPGLPSLEATPPLCSLRRWLVS